MASLSRPSQSAATPALLADRLHTLLDSFINSTRISRYSVALPERWTRFRVAPLMAEVRQAIASLEGQTRPRSGRRERKEWPATAAAVAETIAAGYRCLGQMDATGTPTPFQAPGADQRWLESVAAEPYLEPVRRLRSFFSGSRQPGVLGAWVHGSIATLDYVPGYSDLDTVIVLTAELCCDPHGLSLARSRLGAAAVELRGIDPLQHHGHFVLSELDLRFYHQSHFPLAVWEKAQRLDGEGPLSFDVALVDDAQASLRAFLDHVQHVRRAEATGWRPRTAYDAKLFVQTVVMIPLLALQVIEGRYRYKKEALPAALELIRTRAPEAEPFWDVIRSATRLRNSWRYRPLLTPRTIRAAALVGPSYRFPEQLERLYSARSRRGFEAVMGKDYVAAAARLAEAFVDLYRSSRQEQHG